MKDIGIRELKTRASELVRHVAEDHATYTITRHGRAVSILAPADSLGPAACGSGDQAWARLTVIAERLARKGRRRKSAVRELQRMRR